MGAPVELTTTVVAGIFGLQPAITSAVKDRQQTRRERIRAIAAHRDERGALVTALLVICCLELAIRVAGGVLGAAAGAALAIAGVDPPADYETFIGYVAESTR